MRLLPLPAAGEDVVLDEAGTAYVGCVDGSVWSLDAADEQDRAGRGSWRRVAGTGGRPLGLELLGEDRLVVCDAVRGLLAMHRTTGAVEQLATHAAGQRLTFCNNAAVAPDGAVWFTDSSAVHGIADWRAEMLEVTGTGRLLRRLADGTTEAWVTGLDFANGVALAPDGASVLVAETGARRVRRLWLEGERAGHDDIVVQDLPGYPDNISLGPGGLLWVALASPTVGLLERVRRLPLAVRWSATRVPAGLQPDPKPSVHVQGYVLGDGPGGPAPVLVHDVRRPARDFSMVTGVREHGGELWLATLEQAALAVLDVPATPTS